MRVNKYKKWMVATALLLAITTVRGQVSVQFTNTGYLVTKDQLWNMVLVNTGSAIAACRIEITLSDMAGNQLLCRFTGKNMPLPAGPKNITLQDVLPVQTTNYSPGFTDVNPYGFIPPGRYNMCIDVLRYAEDTYTSIGDYCEDVEAVAFSPVILMMPENMAEIDTRTPLLTWLAPMPLSPFSQLTCQLVLAEVLLNQSPVDAVEHNLPLLNAARIQGTQFSYLPNLPALVPGKIYAWQVTAQNNGSNISVSEVFTFTVQGSTLTAKNIPKAVYTPLKKEAGSFITITGNLNIQYLNELNDSLAHIKIIDLQAAKPAAIVKENLQIPLVYGPNYISLPVRDEYGLQTGRFYKLVLANSKNEEWTVSFRIK